MLDLKRWSRVEYAKLPGLSFEVKRLTRGEYRKLQRIFARVSEKMALFQGRRAEAVAAVESHADEVDQSQKRATAVCALADAFDEMPEGDLERWFTDYVQNVQGCTVDGVEVKTGKDLFELADDDLALHVISCLITHSQLTAPDAKTSASPSTSAADPAPSSGESPAASTESEASLEPSTATETLIVN